MSAPWPEGILEVRGYKLYNPFYSGDIRRSTIEFLLGSKGSMLAMKNVVILAIALGMAFGVTIPKLYKMCQIKGWLTGATARQEIVTQKWNETPAEHPRGRDTYWIAWTNDDIHKVGNHRLNVEAEYWNNLEVGDQIDVVRIANDQWPYLRDGIFVSAGNFAFDGILLAVELGVALTLIIGLVRNRRLRLNAT